MLFRTNWQWTEDGESEEASPNLTKGGGCFWERLFSCVNPLSTSERKMKVPPISHIQMVLSFGQGPVFCTQKKNVKKKPIVSIKFWPMKEFWQGIPSISEWEGAPHPSKQWKFGISNIWTWPWCMFISGWWGLFHYSLIAYPQVNLQSWPFIYRCACNVDFFMVMDSWQLCVWIFLYFFFTLSFLLFNNWKGVFGSPGLILKMKTITFAKKIGYNMYVYPS